MRMGEPEHAGGITARHRAQRSAPRRRERRDDVIERHHRRPVEIVEPGLRVLGLPIDHAERAGRRAKGNRLDAERHHPRGIAQGERGAEQRAVARVLPVEGMAPVVPVGMDTRRVGVGAHADRARRDPIGLAPGEGFGRRHDVGQRLEGFHHRPVIGLVHHRAGAVGEEVEQAGIGMVAVQFGEVREHAAAKAHARKRGAGRAIGLLKAGDAERLDGLEGEVEQPRLFGHDGRGMEPRPPRFVRRRLQLITDGPFARHHDLEHDLGIERLGEISIGGQHRRPVGIARVVLADQMPGPERLDEIDPVAQDIALGRGDTEPDLGHGRAGLSAQRDHHRVLGVGPGPAANRRGAAFEAEGCGLAQRLALDQEIGIGQRQGTVIGLERGVRPIALVLGLPGVRPFEPAGEPDIGRDPVAHGGDVEEGLKRHHEAGERRLFDRAVARG